MNQKSMSSNQTSSFCHNYLYSWLQPFVWISDQQTAKDNQKEALQEIAHSVPTFYDSGKDYEAWRALWTEMRRPSHEIHSDNEDLLKNSFIEVFRDQFRSAFCLHFLAIQLNTFSPFLLYYFFVAILSQNTSNILMMALIVVAARLLRTLFNFVAENKLSLIGQRIYSCIAQAMMDKSTRAALSAEKEEVLGTEMSKMMHLDIQKLLPFMLKKSNVTNNIISVLSNAFILIFLMKWAGLVGFILLFVNFCLYALAFKCSEGNQAQLTQSRDQRVRKSMEVFQMIKFVKIRALQSFFYYKLVKLRDIELKSLRKIFAIQMVPVFITVVCFKIIIMVVVLLVISQQKFDAPIFFAAFLLLNNIYFLKVVLDASFIKEASLAFQTIQKFLLCQQIERSHIKHSRFGQSKEGDVVINIEGSFFWSKQQAKQGEDQVKGVKVTVRHGQLVAVVGPYACGKSSLLKAALGELHPRPNASITLNGSVAYVGQRPWIMNTSVRENVLFGEPFDQVKYCQAVSSACLEADFSLFQNGDATMIGERGCNLSGGQKVRIALARALYSGADVLLLDDILSAVDAHVAASIFFETLKTRLRGCTVLLVTHTLAFLPHTDRIYIFDSGAITAEGSFQAVKSHPTLKQIQSSKGKSAREGKQGDKTQLISKTLAIADEPADSHDSQDISLFIQTNGGNCFLFTMVLFLVMHFSIHTVIIFWMNQWANSNDYQNQMYTLVYVILAVVAGFVSIAIVHHIYTRPHYRDLPAKVIEALLLSPLEYFMSVPSAKIVRVLSSDQRIYDRVLGQSLTRLFLYISAFLSNILVIILVAFIIRNFFFLGNQILFVAALSYICSKFLAAQRKYSGLQNEVKLPMNSTFDETLDGISTIRAHGKQNYQMSLFLQQLARYCRCNTLTSGISASTQFTTTLVYMLFFSISLALLFAAGNQVAYDCVLITCIFRGQDWIVSTYAFIIQFLVNLKSFRRCHELTQLEGEEGLAIRNIDNQEDQDQSCLHEISQLTPQPYAFANNDVEFRGFSARYRGRNTNVLHRISFRVAPGEKIGVVGRTGSGKSTLILSLMRAIGRTQGAILVGGVDIESLPLSQLRAGIAVVMQEHFLFAATVRQNIDPTQAFSDAAVQSALSQCGLWESILHRGGLRAEVAERGSNLSAGERQLLNLARCLLAPRSIVLMDQATAHVDADADQSIQKAIRNVFAKSTVITVAHRITSVVDCDRILVLDGGRIAELDSSKALMNNPKSLFRKLCEETASSLKETYPCLKASSSVSPPSIRFSYK